MDSLACFLVDAMPDSAIPAGSWVDAVKKPEEPAIPVDACTDSVGSGVKVDDLKPSKISSCLRN